MTNGGVTLGMRLDGELGIPSVNQCLIPSELPVSPCTSPVHSRRAFLGVPDGAGVAPSRSLPRPRQGHHHWSLGRTRGARVGSLRHTPGLLGSGRNSGGWEAPEGRGASGSALLCCLLRPGLSFPECRGTGGLARLLSPRGTLQEAFPTCQLFIPALPASPFSLASQAESPGAFQGALPAPVGPVPRGRPPGQWAQGQLGLPSTCVCRGACCVFCLGFSFSFIAMKFHCVGFSHPVKMCAARSLSLN